MFFDDDARVEGADCVGDEGGFLGDCFHGAVLDGAAVFGVGFDVVRGGEFCGVFLAFVSSVSSVPALVEVFLVEEVVCSVSVGVLEVLLAVLPVLSVLSVLTLAFVAVAPASLSDLRHVPAVSESVVFRIVQEARSVVLEPRPGVVVLDRFVMMGNRDGYFVQLVILIDVVLLLEQPQAALANSADFLLANVVLSKHAAPRAPSVEQ